VVFTFLSGMGYEVKAEDTTNRGRIDMTMIGRDRIYIIEFKVDKAEEEALAQIKSRKYYEKYLTEQKTICLLGIHFDSSQRNISGFAFAEIRSAGLF
jgi:RecB family endonuclease NucS